MNQERWRRVEFPTDWSVGDRIVMNQDQTTGSTEIWTGSAAGDDEPRLLKRAGGRTGGGLVSPDGRWLAYVSDESGTLEVYVSPFDGSSKHRISTAGGIQPRWQKGGRELLYLGPDNVLMSVAVEPGGKPATVLRGALRGGGRWRDIMVVPRKARGVWNGDRECGVVTRTHAMSK